MRVKTPPLRVNKREPAGSLRGRVNTPPAPVNRNHYIPGVDTDWGAMFTRLLGDQSKRGFCERTGTDRGSLNKILRGENPVPFKRINAWADALKLNDEDRLVFMALAAITHIPEDPDGQVDVRSIFREVLDTGLRLRGLTDKQKATLAEALKNIAG
jgi:transcriptional regulator with XRE-family HTH domain